MTDFENTNSTDRDELLQRVALMETMIAEGRASTGRYGWIFVAWGFCYIIAALWAGMGPYPGWAWPVCLAITIPVVAIGQSRQVKAAAARGTITAQSRVLGGLWLAFGVGISLFCTAAAASHHIGDAIFVSALCFFLGTVNVTSASIYRWKMQGVAGLIWWAAGVVGFFAGPNGAGIAFLVATFLSQIVFGFYLMAVERRRGPLHASVSAV
jgi:hypothetical protein